jgi:hypothetical protein
LLAGATAAALAAPTATPITTWVGGVNAPSAVGYIEGAPIVAGGVIYGVLGNTPTGTTASYSGSVYALTPPASGTTYTQATISSFTGGTGGGNPVGRLYADASGNLYGAASTGGTSATACGPYGCGLIYKLTNSGGTWTRTTIYAFKGTTADGFNPVGDLIADSSGNLYGVTQGGDGCTPAGFYPTGCGIVFKLTPPASGNTYTETILYSFKGNNDGALPSGSLAMDASGNLFGTTQFGGTAEELCGTLPSGLGDGRCGTVFELVYNSSTNSYTEKLLHMFTNGADGSIPSYGAVIDKNGNIYGTTLQGGNAGACADWGFSGCGVVWQMTKSSSYATFNTIHAFGGNDGGTPAAILINRKGHIFGNTSNNTAAETCTASAYYCGTAFELIPVSATWVENVLYKFSGSSNVLTGPQYGLAADTAGHLIGVSITANSTEINSYAFVLGTAASGTLDLFHW